MARILEIMPGIGIVITAAWRTAIWYGKYKTKKGK